MFTGDEHNFKGGEHIFKDGEHKFTVHKHKIYRIEKKKNTPQFSANCDVTYV